MISGGSDGIGAEFARQLASHGLNLLLISRTEAKLEVVASNLRKEHMGLQVRTLSFDFAADLPLEDLYKPLEKALADLSEPVAVLVNNVGANYAHPRAFLEGPLEEDWNILRVNTGAITILTKLILPRMIAR